MLPTSALLRRKFDMKRTLKLGTVIVLFWSAIVFAQAPPSAEKNLEHAMATGGIEILTDTKGVDFSAYTQVVQQMVKRNWYSVIPITAGPPLYKRGKVSIEFAITKNGQVAGLHYVSSSGDVVLDRAAYGGITASNPFPPLPTEFHGQYLELRFTFFYNPSSTGSSLSLTGISPPRLKVPAGSSVLFVPILNGITDQTKFPISWSVVGQGCAESACGTVSQNGMYTAPLKVPENPIITVKATAAADVGETASAVVTILQPDTSQNTVRH